MFFTFEKNSRTCFARNYREKTEHELVASRDNSDCHGRANITMSLDYFRFRQQLAGNAIRRPALLAPGMDMRAGNSFCDGHPVGSCASSASTGADETSHALAEMSSSMNQLKYDFFVGIDLGQWLHLASVVDAKCNFLAERGFPHSREGLSGTIDWLLEETSQDTERIAVAIEKPHGAVVELFLDHGIAIFSINPKQVDRFRDRHSMSGAKDDRRDAFVLADSLRTVSAAELVPGAIGLSSSSVSRGFVEASAAKLREMQERDLSGEDVVAMVLDGKTFADATMVVALGITLSGDKRFLGFVETDTENERVLRPFLRSLVERGLDISEGLLVVIDGSKGLRGAVTKAFRRRVVVGRCQWHKRENVVSYLSKSEQSLWRKRLQRAYGRPTHKEALEALEQLHRELEERNQSAASSLEEGLEETLTLHRLGVYGVLGHSLKTTNCIESVNALIEERCAKVDHWKTSNQRQRWLATALTDIEPRLRKVMGYRHLPKLREALKRELKIETAKKNTSRKNVA